MKARRLKRATMGVALGMAACTIGATSPARAAEDFSIPTYAGVYQPTSTDERGLWSLDDEDERKLRDSTLVLKDEALNAYLHNVLCRTVGEERCGNVRIYVIRAPVFNASMSPNGTMRVYTGLLLRARNEAELASVLAHEFAHFELRHTLQSYKAHRQGTDLLAWAALLGAAAATYGSGSGFNYNDLAVSVYGSLMQFNRKQEMQADVLGFAYIAKAGYRPSAAAEVWRAMMNEADSRARDRGQRSTRYDREAFFSTHPTDLQRADYLSGLANRVSGGDFEGGGQFADAMAAWRTNFLADQLKLNDFGGSEYLLQRLAGDEWSAPLLFARGELYRTRGNPRDLVDAAQFYRQALVLEPQMSAAMRGLGLSLLRGGSRDDGRTALQNYLSARPDAEDAALLRSLVQ